jgi:hypothetical protein
MRTQRATIVAVVLALVAAAPASAVTGGFGVANALRGQLLPISTVDGTSAKKHTLCEATGSRASNKLMSQFEKQFVPVACEQPPRSLVLTSDAFRKATAAALSALG